MNNELDNDIQYSYNKALARVNEIVEVFNHFYNENQVDLQGFPSINTYIKCVHGFIDLGGSIEDMVINGIKVIVHIPKVRITNENNKYIDITNLYIETCIDEGGYIIGAPRFARSEYTKEQLYYSYIHSHVKGTFNIFNNLKLFRECCLGKGPLVCTIANLSTNFDINIWKLYCIELFNYIQVESLTGGPYKKLESISIEDTPLERNHTIGSIPTIIKSFMKYFITTNQLSFRWSNNKYELALSHLQYAIIVSNSFINWFNSLDNSSITYCKEISNSVLNKVTIINGNIYLTKDNYSKFDNHIGEILFTFKNKDVVFNITNKSNNNNNLIIKHHILSYILDNILLIINYEYNRGKNQTDRINTKVRYI